MGVSGHTGVSNRAGISNRPGVSSVAGVSLDSSDGYPWSPQDIPNIAYWMPAAFTDALYQQTYYSVVTNVSTHATADNDPVGAVYAPINALSTYAISSVTHPVLSTGPSGRSMLYFGGPGGNGGIEITNSQQIFDYLYTTYNFTIMFRIFMPAGTDGVVHTFCDSVNSTGGNIGLGLTRTTDNKLQLQIGNGGANVVLQKSAGTLTADGAEHVVRVSVIGSGVGALTMQIDNNTPETFTAAASGVAIGTLASFSLILGSRQSNQAPGVFKMSDFIIVNGAMSAADIALYKAYNPSRQSTSLLRITPTSSGTIDGTSISNLMCWWDQSLITDPKDSKTLLFTDTARTVAVSADGNNINAVATRQLSSKIRRFLTLSAGSASSPIYKTNIQNGLSVARFSGSNNGVTSTYQAWDLNQQMPPGNKHIFVVVRNNSNGTPASTGQSGSHLFAQSQTQYMVCTGNLYGGNPNRILTHNSGGVSTPNLTNVNGGIGLNIQEMVCTAGTFQMVSCGVPGPVLAADGNYFSANNIGKNSHQIGGGQEPDATGYWELNGDYMDCYIFQDVLPSSVAAAFRANLATKWNIANVV